METKNYITLEPVESNGKSPDIRGQMFFTPETVQQLVNFHKTYGYTNMGHLRVPLTFGIWANQYGYSGMFDPYEEKLIEDDTERELKGDPRAFVLLKTKGSKKSEKSADFYGRVHLTQANLKTLLSFTKSSSINDNGQFATPLYIALWKKDKEKATGTIVAEHKEVAPLL